MNRILTVVEFNETVDRIWKESEKAVAEFDALMERSGYVQVEYLTEWDINEKPRYRRIK